MNPLKSFALVFCCLTLLAGSADARSLTKRHKIGLSLGMWSQVADTRTEIGLGTVSTSVGGSGFMGGVSYCHWMQENLALEIRIGAMAADVDVNVAPLDVTSKTATVTQLLLGLKYYVSRSTYGTSVRPFVSAGMGTFVGSQVETSSGLTVVVESRTGTAMGGQIGAGVDFVLGRHILLGVSGGYNFMTDFDEPIGGSKNYGGPEFTFGIGYLFGKGTI